MQSFLTSAALNFVVQSKFSNIFEALNIHSFPRR
jgi:hypothetical protein